MNRDEIIKLAREAGFVVLGHESANALERFAALVAAAERERAEAAWKGYRKALTDEQIADIEDMFSNEFGLEAKHAVDFARAIEEAIWKKNS